MPATTCGLRSVDARVVARNADSGLDYGSIAGAGAGSSWHLLRRQFSEERADVWWSSVLCTQFGDGAMEVAWTEFVHLFRVKYIPEHYEAKFVELSKYAPHIVADERRKVRKFIMGLKPSLRTRLVALGHRSMEQALSAACMQEAEMEVYLAEKRASLKRPASAFQCQDKKKKAPGYQQRAVAPKGVAAPTPGGGT
ncbi:hypothetical protein Taro_002778, partial [Colocasia esculenta]|nr:hypothetical protein [Colocasia esculenta]